MVSKTAAVMIPGSTPPGSCVVTNPACVVLRALLINLPIDIVMANLILMRLGCNTY